ncbi:hypothetical protein Pint_24217 [Pistacia integerrima]|uniref:Uncharacterized protein n=1 Tax=Pistacia integerrima TaxID=434235 RepID=A0ACC0YDG2_9ROSI|nr:hypothetical protein Pint_24217 [Pistacia integerrima]
MPEPYLDKLIISHSLTAKYWFSASQEEYGWPRFMSFTYLNLPSTGCLAKGVCLVKAEGKQRRFHGLKPEWGFDQFIPIKVFSDASNGYLVDDTSALGAEVFVSKERSTGKGECLEMIKDPSSFKHVWKIEHFSKLASEYYYSKEFTAAGYKWYNS